VPLPETVTGVPAVVAEPTVADTFSATPESAEAAAWCATAAIEHDALEVTTEQPTPTVPSAGDVALAATVVSTLSVTLVALVSFNVMIVGDAYS